MKILITNDDGIKSENLRVLVQSVVKHYPNDEVVVVAPETEQSAVSHAIQIKKPVHIYRSPDIVSNVKTYMVDSTPTDCVILAKNELKYDFNILFSGINNGLNLGIDVMYSGTCAAALEGLLYCDFTVAFSCNNDTVEGFLKGENEVFELIKNNSFKNTCLNINFPRDPKGLKFACQKSIYKTNENKDVNVVEEGYISITPLRLDATDYKELSELKTKINLSCKKIK